jgi:hypothetical protein
VQIQRRLGRDNFPLIEQTFYPNHREMVSPICIYSNSQSDPDFQWKVCPPGLPLCNRERIEANNNNSKKIRPFPVFAGLPNRLAIDAPFLSLAPFPRWFRCSFLNEKNKKQLKKDFRRVIFSLGCTSSDMRHNGNVAP